MALYNTDAFRLKNLIGFDPLFGKAPLPEEIRSRDLHTVRSPAGSRHVAIRATLAGRHVSTRTRVSGGTFAPRATSGMS